MKKLLSLASFIILFFTRIAHAQQTPIKSVNTTFLFGDRLINCQLVKNMNSYDIKLYDHKYGFRDSLVNTYVLNQIVFDNFCNDFFIDCKDKKIVKAISDNNDKLSNIRKTVYSLKTDSSKFQHKLDSINKKTPKTSIDSIALKKVTDSLHLYIKNLKNKGLTIDTLRSDSLKFKNGTSIFSTKFKGDSTFFNQYVAPTIYQDLYTQLLTDPNGVLDIAQIKLSKTIPIYLYYPKEFKLQKRLDRDYWNDSIKALKFSMKKAHNINRDTIVKTSINRDTTVKINNKDTIVKVSISYSIITKSISKKSTMLTTSIANRDTIITTSNSKKDTIVTTSISKRETIKKNHNDYEYKPNARNKIYPETALKYKISLADYKNQKKAIKKRSKKKLYLDTLKKTIPQATILNSQFIFKDGFIEQILIQAKVNKVDKRNGLFTKDYEIITFGNTYSIGISTFRNIKDLENIYLFEEEKKRFRAARVITLGDLIDYTKILQEDTRDYSPKNQKATFYPDTLYTLSKEQTNKLLEFRVYTDLAGIEETSPNGLIQTELAKRIVTNAKRIRIFRKYGFSWGTYIEPIFTLSKIENKFKYLTPDTITGSNGLEKFSSPLKLYQYQFLQVGSRVNLLYLENRINIYDIYLNGFFNFGLTKFKDTILTSSNYYEEIRKNLTTLTTGFELGICFYPEKRYSFGIHDRAGIQIPLFGDIAYYSVKNYVNETGTNPDRWINTIELHGHIYTSDRGKVFARFRFNHQFTDWRNNFSQFQIGYSIYLLDRNK